MSVNPATESFFSQLALILPRDAIVEAMANAITEAKRTTTYRVTHNKLIVIQECTFTKEDLLRIIMEMEKK